MQPDAEHMRGKKYIKHISTNKENKFENIKSIFRFQHLETYKLFFILNLVSHIYKYKVIHKMHLMGLDEYMYLYRNNRNILSQFAIRSLCE